jgi:hypothetical protein
MNLVQRRTPRHEQTVKKRQRQYSRVFRDHEKRSDYRGYFRCTPKPKAITTEGTEEHRANEIYPVKPCLPCS